MPKTTCSTPKYTKPSKRTRTGSSSSPFALAIGLCFRHCTEDANINQANNTERLSSCRVYDGPYHILNTDEAHSTVTLDMPHKPNLFPIFHTSEIHPFQENDDTLFPQRALRPPAPIVIDEQKKFFIEKIVDERRQGKRRQYLVRWRGKGPEGDEWLPASEVEDCEALDFWEARASNKPPPEKLMITIPAR
jgi:hypothetical protein